MNTSLKRRIRETLLKNKPTMLHRLIVLLLVCMVALSTSMSDIMYSTQMRVEQLLSAVLPSVVVELTNSERSDRNLSELTRNPLLDKAARLKAEHMRDNNYFAHFSPEGVSPWYWFDQARYDYMHAGENLAVFFDDSDEVVQAWMDSPLHRDNILKAEYTEIGVATVKTKHEGYDTVFVVQLFGTPNQKPALVTKPTATPQTKVLASESVQNPPKENIEEIQTLEFLGTKTMQTETPSSEEKEEAVVTAIENTPQDNSTLVTQVPIDGKTVYVAPHMSTMNISQYTQPTQTNPEPRKGNGVYIFKEILYMFMLFVVVSLLVIALLHARVHHNFVHAFYTLTLVLATLASLTLHTHIITASTFFPYF